MHNNHAIKVEGLTATYGENLVFKDLDFHVNYGEIFVILGPSGCGKSTLIRHMLGLNLPSSGRIFIDGQNITEMNTRGKIGVLFQSSALLGSLTVGENIALPLEGEEFKFPKDLVRRLVHLKLCMVDLGGYENYMPSELSGGMKKRAGLARAMILDPKILFLDEPSAGLDPVTAAGIDELILRIRKRYGTTIVVVTHELESIIKIADRVIMLGNRGKGIIASGDPRRLKNESKDPYVIKFFNRQI